jgi:2,3-bisphosphoglycerate-dependent phosphoglycerate mutase
MKHQQKTLSKPQQRYAMPEGAKEVIVVRHGSTDLENAGMITINGRPTSNPVLLPEGEKQAEAVCRRLARENISRIFITNLQRTRQTAERLINATGIEPYVIDDLREVHMGDWEQDFHIKSAENDDIIAEMFTRETWDVIPNAEPATALAVRVKRGMDTLVSWMEPNTTAALFTHGGVIAELCHQATGSRRFAFMAPENTSISRIVVHADGHWTLRSFNDVAHL